MVATCSLFDNYTDRILTLNHVEVDICKSITIIVKKHETFRLPLTVSLIQIVGRKITVMYDNDYCLVLIPY